MSVLLNAATTLGITFTVITIAMSGYDTSQTNLSNQVNTNHATVLTSIDSFRSVTSQNFSDLNSKLDAHFTGLSGQITGMKTELSERVSGGEIDVVEMRAEVSAMQHRLGDTITRQNKIDDYFFQLGFENKLSLGTLDGTPIGSELGSLNLVDIPPFESTAFKPRRTNSTFGWIIEPSFTSRRELAEQRD